MRGLGNGRALCGRFRLGLRIALPLAVATAALAQTSGAPVVDFNRDIRPILSDNCFTCHGPDEKQRMVGLRLDTREGLFAERNGYRIIDPGNPSRSRLMERITAENKALRMPPVASDRTLTSKQIDLIRAWIEQGAKWEMHWAFVAPVRPELPAVRDAAWVRNPIDRFVLARLEREGLQPSPEADRITLLRRVTLDLTGLPPTPSEVDSFLADKSLDAHERRVNVLLDSPRYGERMAQPWLDLARYADTHGFHIDSHRDMWPWRDWVIQAFNRNLPYDRFTLEQLAGDLLANATREQKIASGFNRNHMINFEGGAIPEEYLNEYIVDRVETTATAWMGLTMGCARCHDHKYDPISQKEFYRFYAFFNSVEEKGLDGREGNARPVLRLPTIEQQERLEELKCAVESREFLLATPEAKALQEQWEKERVTAMEPAPREGLLAHYELDGNLSDSSGRYQYARVLRGDVSFGPGPVARSADFNETHAELGEAGDFDRNDPFTLALWVRPGGTKEMIVLGKLEDAQSRRGYELGFEEFLPIGDLKRGAKLSFRLVHRWPESAIHIRTTGPLVQGDWYHVAVTHDGSGAASGLRLYLNGEPAEYQVLQDSLSGSTRTAAKLAAGNKEWGGRFRGRMDDLRLYDRALSPESILSIAVEHPVRLILLGSGGKRSEEETERVRDFFLTREAPEIQRRMYAELKELKEEQRLLMLAIPTVMVMAEAEKPRETHVLGRGDYRNLGETVEAGVPSALPPLPKDAPANRIGLAQWLLDPAHPLTARVAVNRFWQMYFGLGLVKTAENFGSQGEPPSHPELLDWLATEFVRSGWDIKGMQRLIVTSATYRQASNVTPALLEKDPENRLLARGPRFRLPA